MSDTQETQDEGEVEPRKRRSPLIILIIALAVTAITATVLLTNGISAPSQETPTDSAPSVDFMAEAEHPVTDYFDAVASGDASRIASLTGINLDGDDPLISTRVLSNPTPIGEYDLSVDHSDEGAATITVTYPDSVVTDEFKVVRDKSEWRLDGVTPKPITFSAAQLFGSVMVNGYRIDFGEVEGDTVSLMALPGMYTFWIAEDNPLVQSAPVTARAGSETVPLIRVPRIEVEDSMYDILESWMKSCLDSSRGIRDEGCPNWKHGEGPSDSIIEASWVIERQPGWAFDLNSAISHASLKAFTPGILVVTYSYMSEEQRVVTETESWEFGGSAILTLDYAGSPAVKVVGASGRGADPDYTGDAWF